VHHLALMAALDLCHVLIRHDFSNPSLYMQHTAAGNLAIALMSSQVDDKTELEV
jgi:hypothetical protein